MVEDEEADDEFEDRVGDEEASVHKVLIGSLVAAGLIRSVNSCVSCCEELTIDVDISSEAFTAVAVDELNEFVVSELVVVVPDMSMNLGSCRSRRST